MLPTRFGNANRAFETYAERVHGVDAILIWPRLSGVLSKDMQAALSDARAQVDCFINLCFLSLCFCGVQLGAAAWRLASQFGPDMTSDGPVRAALNGLGQAWPAALMAVAGLVVARLCYEIAIGRVWALGEQVKAAFDLFLPALPAALGYAPPRPWAERKKFWRSLEDAYLTLVGRKELSRAHAVAEAP